MDPIGEGDFKIRNSSMHFLYFVLWLLKLQKEERDY